MAKPVVTLTAKFARYGSIRITGTDHAELFVINLGTIRGSTAVNVDTTLPFSLRRYNLHTTDAGDTVESQNLALDNCAKAMGYWLREAFGLDVSVVVVREP